MAKLIVSISLVNGGAFPDREVSAYELFEQYVGDDLRPPARNLELTVYTDDGHEVFIGIPPDGRGEIWANVKPWNGEPAQAEPPPKLMANLRLSEIVALIGEPTVKGKSEEPFAGTDRWPCGCYASTGLAFSSNDDRDTALLDWVQCDEHRGIGPPPHRPAPQRFGD